MLLSPCVNSHCCGVRSVFKYWGTAKSVCVQLQVSVLGVRATELCVHLQKTADEAADERRLENSQQTFVGGVCVTRCSCWQGRDSRHPHTGRGTTWGMTQVDKLSQSRGKEPLENFKAVNHPSTTHSEEGATGLSGVRWDGISAMKAAIKL